MKILTRKEFCKVLNISLPTVDKAIKNGMPHLLVSGTSGKGSTIRIPFDEAIKWMQGGKNGKSTTQA